MKTRTSRWWHKLCYRWSTPYRHDVDLALRTELHRGIGIGMKQNKMTDMIYCDQCGTQVIAPDAVYCRICGSLLPKATGPIQKVTSEATKAQVQVKLPPGYFSQLYRHAQGSSPQSQVLHAVSQKQLLEWKAQQMAEEEKK